MNVSRDWRAVRLSTKRGHQTNCAYVHQLTYRTDRPYDEVKKTKAIESKRYPQPSSIRQTLGKHLGDVVVECIPTDILKRLKSEMTSDNLQATVETYDNVECIVEFITGKRNIM